MRAVEMEDGVIRNDLAAVGAHSQLMLAKLDASRIASLLVFRDRYRCVVENSLSPAQSQLALARKRSFCWKMRHRRVKATIDWRLPRKR